MIDLLDPTLRGPLFGSILMSVCASITGVLALVRKKLLVGETISHATYPGIVLGGFASLFVIPFFPSAVPFIVLVFAFFGALAGVSLMQYLEKSGNLSSDSAQCFTLSFLLGIGVFLASFLQFESPALYRQVQGYLYGQVVTLSDLHIYLYAVLTTVIALIIVLRFREIELVSFDSVFAETTGVQLKRVEQGVLLLLALSIVVGIRSVGVVLIAGMLIAPAVVARQLTNSFSKMFGIAAVVGGGSSALGHILSLRFDLPPGPVILLVACMCSLLALFFAPKKGLVARIVRSMTFSLQCMSENVLKFIWKENRAVSLKTIVAKHTVPVWLKIPLLWKMQYEGWIERNEDGELALTVDGANKAQRIVRLHRLWEVYLVQYMAVSEKRVHQSAERIEHILVPELEEELLQLVGSATHDPHKKPIPEGRGAI